MGCRDGAASWAAQIRSRTARGPRCRRGLAGTFWPPAMPGFKSPRRRLAGGCAGRVMIIEPWVSGGRSVSSSARTTTGFRSRQDVMSRRSVSTYADRRIRIRRWTRRPAAGYKPPTMARGMTAGLCCAQTGTSGRHADGQRTGRQPTASELLPLAGLGRTAAAQRSGRDLISSMWRRCFEGQSYWRCSGAQSGAERRPASRAPRRVTAAIPAANTSAAQMAAPRSCGGRAGQIHGVVQPAARTDSVASQ